MKLYGCSKFQFCHPKFSKKWGIFSPKRCIFLEKSYATRLKFSDRIKFRGPLPPPPATGGLYKHHRGRDEAGEQHDSEETILTQRRHYECSSRNVNDIVYILSSSPPLMTAASFCAFFAAYLPSCGCPPLLVTAVCMAQQDTYYTWMSWEPGSVPSVRRREATKGLLRTEAGGAF